MKPIILKAKEIKTLQVDGKVAIGRAIKRLKLHSDYGEPNWDRAWIDNSYDPPCLKVEYSGLCCGIPDPTIHRHWSPYSPGDRLWVRETWLLYNHMGTFVGKSPKKQPFDLSIGYKADGLDKENLFTWHPPSQMPKWASRFTVEVTAVTVKQNKTWDWVYELKRIEP